MAEKPCFQVLPEPQFELGASFAFRWQIDSLLNFRQVDTGVGASQPVVFGEDIRID